jgi:hypothetical protein
MNFMTFDSPLSDDEYSRLADFCDEYTTLGIDGLLGLLHAVAVAPGLMPPSSWLNKAVPDRSLSKAKNPKEIVGFI